MKNIISLLILLSLGIVSFAQTNNKQIVYSDKAPKAIGPYSQGILAGSTLYLSGQIAINPETGKIDTSSFENEIRQVLVNLGEVLNAAGMNYDDVVKTTIYTTDLRHFKTINTIYAEYFKVKQPARETVQVVALPGKAHVEISGIAVKKPLVPVSPGNEE